MAPAAADTIYQSFIDFEMESVDFDRIITGDLGAVGQKLLLNCLTRIIKILRKIIWIAECRYLMKKVRIPMQEEVDVPVLH